MESSAAGRKVMAGVAGLLAIGAAVALLRGVFANTRGPFEQSAAEGRAGAAAADTAKSLPLSTTPKQAQRPVLPAEAPLPSDDRARAMELLQVLKQRANAAFQEGRYEAAVMGYQDCINITSALGAGDREAVAAEQVIRANVVMTFIKQHQYADARLVATMLLQEDEDRGCPVEADLKVKVLYRRGLASKALGEREAALADFRAAVKLSPGGTNPMAEREIALLSNHFVIVKIVLSAICKVLEAAFDINGRQFTFHCRPYYLRLTFEQQLQEAKGERATYDLDTNTLTVYVPKAVTGETFTQLTNPGYLIATERQRRQLISVVGGDPDAVSGEHHEGESATSPTVPHDGGDEEEETEFVQTLPTTAAGLEPGTPAVHYGFANHFSGLFDRLDPDLVSEMVAVPTPETTTPAERRALRLCTENAAFDEEAVLLAFEDAEGEVAEVLRYVPAHITDFQRALQADSIVYAALPHPSTRAVEEEGLEEEAVPLPAGGGGSVDIWGGNVAEFTTPSVVAEAVGATPSVPPSGQTPVTAPVQLTAAPGPAPVTAITPVSSTRLAIPRNRPQLAFTAEESDALMRLRMPRLLFPPSAGAVAALTVDLLLAEAYDDLVTGGQGCSETLWNVTQLSPALSFLDSPATVYEACVAFARRVLVYPLHRHLGIVQRVFAVVGTRLLLGHQYVVRALLRVRRVLSHAEHKHVLATIFTDPLIAYWMNVAEADARLARVALELHDHATRTEPVAVVKAAERDQGTGSPFLLTESRTMLLQPIHLLSLGLPFEE